MSNRLLKILPILLAFFVICSVSAFAVFADEASVEESAEVSAEDSAETSVEESAEESAEASADESAETSATVSTETSAAVSAESQVQDDEEEKQSNIPWQLIITIAVIIVIVAVLFILAKTKTKVGLAIAKFFKDYKSEIKKVVWMPRKDLLKSTGIVLLVLVVACIVIGLLDLGFSALLNLISSIG